MVHSSKTTRVTTLVQENFFCVLKKTTQCNKNRASISWSIFCKIDLTAQSAAQGGPSSGQHQSFDWNRWWTSQLRFWRRKKWIFSSSLWNISSLLSRPPLYVTARPVSFSSPWFQAHEKQKKKRISALMSSQHEDAEQLDSLKKRNRNRFGRQ